MSDSVCPTVQPTDNQDDRQEGRPKAGARQKGGLILRQIISIAYFIITLSLSISSFSATSEFPLLSLPIIYGIPGMVSFFMDMIFGKHLSRKHTEVFSPHIPAGENILRVQIHG
jgi:hypothetical protein